MSFAIGWAGFVAVVVTLAAFGAFRALGLTGFSPTVQLGCLFFRNPRHPGAETTGFVLLALLGSTVVPLIYARLFSLLGGPSWAAGFGLGAAHGLLTAALLPVFGMISACIRAGALPAPGPLGTRWGWLTPFILIVGHGLYGSTCGAILGNL